MDIKDVLTLSDGNSYVIASKVDYNYKIYLYLVDINNYQNIKFGYLDNDEVVIIKDKELIQKLLPLLLKEMHNIFN